MHTPPIALFTYNRPDKTLAVLEAIKSQGVGRIYIFCDGPKSDETDRRLVEKNLDTVKKFPMEQKTIHVSKENKGLAASLISGITKTLAHEKELIILEDDCLPFKGMLRYMTENLAHWRVSKEIFSVSAYHFIRPLEAVNFPFDVFFSSRFLPWGWGTWQDRWSGILADLQKKKNPFGCSKDVPDRAGRDLPYHSYAVENNMVDSWAIPLGLLCLKHGYRHVMPARPLVNNTGMDDTGTNTGSSHNRIIPVTKPPQYDFPLKMCPQDYKNPCLDKQFLDSLDVMLPPPWLEKKNT